MILETNAVIDPGAVVIVPLAAAVADTAVPRSRRFDDKALWTQVQGVDCLHQFLQKNMNYKN